MLDRRAFLRSAGTTTLLGLTALAGCNTAGSSDVTATPSSSVTDPPTATDTSGKSVTMSGNNAAGLIYFSPVGLFVEPGETVTWRAESGQHSTTAFHPENDTERRIPQDAEPWYSGPVSYGTFEHTFEVEGTYDYYCSIHYNHGMVGRLVVGEPGGPAQGTQTPHGRVPSAEQIVEQGSISYFDFTEESG